MIVALGKFIAFPPTKAGIEKDVSDVNVHSLALFVMLLMGRIQNRQHSAVLFDWDYKRYFSIPENYN
jgi:hypothetical protein